MSSEGVIKIKGDASEFIKSLDDSQRKMVEVGKHAEKAHGHVKTFGEAWEHANLHMAKSIVHALSLGGALKESVNLMREYQERAREAATKVDDLTVKRSIAAAKLGLEDSKLEALTGAGSPVEAKDLVGLAGKLAEHGANSSVRTGRRITSEEAIRALGLARQGILSPDEILDATLKGQVGNLEGRNREILSRMSPEAREIIASRTRTVSYNEKTEEKDAVGGRSYGERYDYATSVLARAGGAISWPVFRQILAMSSALQNLSPENPSHLPKVAIEAYQPTKLRSEYNGPVIEELKKQTAEMTKPEKPTVSPGVH